MVGHGRQDSDIFYCRIKDELEDKNQLGWDVASDVGVFAAASAPPHSDRRDGSGQGSEIR
jgi:hypothetical protein